MKTLIVVLALIFLGATASRAQSVSTSNEAPSWQRLQGLPSGMGIAVKAHRAASTNCFLKSVSETEMACVGGNGTPYTFQRSDLKSVKIRHRGRSTLTGLAIGAAAGAAVGAPLGKSGSFVGHGAAAVIFAVPGAIIGTVIGATTDFTHSTVYKAR